MKNPYLLVKNVREISHFYSILFLRILRSTANLDYLEKVTGFYFDPD